MSPARRAARPAGGVPGPLWYADLGAVVHPDGRLADAPAELLAELLACCTANPFSTAEYFATYDRPQRVGVCAACTSRAAFVIFFAPHGATADVLNKVAAMEPAAFERVTAAITTPRACAASGPRSSSRRAEHCTGRCARPFVATTRSSIARRAAFLGVGVASRHLDAQAPAQVSQRAAPEHRTSGSRRSKATPSRCRWSRRNPRMEPAAICGKASPGCRRPGCDRAQAVAPSAAPRLGALCRNDGDRSVRGYPAAVRGRRLLGDTGGFDPFYEDVHLGALMASFAICDAIALGYARMHLTWGTIDYKQHLGAAPVTAYRVSVYRSRFDRALYARERWALLVRDRNDIYWQARRALKRRLVAVPPLGRLAAARDADRSPS